MRWTDNHCHLGWRPDGAADDTLAESIDAAVADAQAAGVQRIITVGTDARRSAQAVAAAQRHPGVVWATVGLHPHEASQGLGEIDDLLARGVPREVLAIGECGLDYHYDHSPRPAQRDMFAVQIARAHARGLGLVVHSRDAWDDTFAILDSEGVPERSVLHCFTGGPDEVRGCLDRGMYVSFSGIVTFNKAHDVQAAAALCPLERLLVETDSPYLAPAPYRGKPNRPALLPLVGAGLAQATGRPVEEIAEVTWANASHVYGLE
jgi:TatD DNase family protein